LSLAIISKAKKNAFGINDSRVALTRKSGAILNMVVF